jgi:hypothetical protein
MPDRHARVIDALPNMIGGAIGIAFATTCELALSSWALLPVIKIPGEKIRQISSNCHYSSKTALPKMRCKQRTFVADTAGPWR